MGEAVDSVESIVRTGLAHQIAGTTARNMFFTFLEKSRSSTELKGSS